MTHVRQLGLAGGAVLAVVLASCSTSSSPPPAPSPPPASALVIPAPDQSGPQVTVEGTVVWRTEHIGCAEMVTTAGQRLRLTGQLATDRERATLGGAAPTEQLRITGYIPRIGATVCVSGIPFVAEKVEPMRH